MYALKLELKLNNKERSWLAGCAGFARFTYNFGLSMITQSWGFEGIKAGDCKRLVAIEKVFTNHVKTNPEYAWMKQHPAAIYSSAFRNLANAIERWRKGISEFPQMKTKKGRHCFTVLKKAGVYPAKGEPMLPFSNRQVLYPGKRITIPGLGKFRLKQPIPFICSSQTFTISKTGDRWYVSFTIDADKVPPIVHEVESVGIDLGVKCFATLSDSSRIVAPPTLKTAKAVGAGLDFSLSRQYFSPARLNPPLQEQWHNRNKQLGHRRQGIRASNNAKKYYQRLSKRHARIANVRKDFLQKATTDISRKYYRIRIEDLNVSGMIANHKLAEAVSNQGFYEFRRMLTYKEAFYGTKVEVVDRWYPSSKMCSCCGNIQSMPLSERVYSCNQCGHTQDRDLNAAINLENAPLDRVRVASTELTPVERKEPTPLTEAGSKRQSKRVNKLC